ncbi:MAG TPA: SDR family oxidoreductase [Firmicutes bacterium]|nr:SDR family oxidoreductase [Bacillota bacterium]
MFSYIVTGGAGFIGSNIVKHLVSHGHKVKVIDNLSTGKRYNLDSIIDDIEFIEGDIRDSGMLLREFKGFDYISHQAALPSVARSVANPYESFESNVMGTLNVLSSAVNVGIKRVVFASSSSIYGNSPKLPKCEEDPVNPMSPYAVSKYAAERLTVQYHNFFSLETVALRYFNVFGPFQDPESQYAAVIPRFITSVLLNKSPVIYGDGNQSRDFTYIENVVDANLKALSSPGISGEVFNIACNERFSLIDIIDYLSKISGVEVKPIFEEERKGDVKHSLASIEKSGVRFGYKPRISFKEGLEKTFKWFQEMKKEG